MKKITVENMIKKHFGGDRHLVAEKAKVSTVNQVNNWVSEGRSVIELKEGGFVLLSDKVKIIEKP